MTHYSPIKKPVRSDISLRMSLYAVIISLFFAAISVVLLIYIESNQAERELIRKTSEIVDTIEQQIGQYLWDIDDNGIQTTLQRVVELPYIKGASIEGGLGSSFYIGDQSTPEKISRDIFLYEQNLGVLKIGYNVEEFKSNAYEKYRSTIFIVLFTIGLMSLVFYVIVNREIIRHITFISHSAKLFSLYTAVDFFPLSLQRKPKNDEINDLVDVLNDGRKSAVELLHAKKDYEEQMAYQANFDLLTGLPNRCHLYSYLNQQLEEYEIEKGPLAIFFIDLDGFKQVNDSMGHNVGDKVLNECAMRLQKVANDFDAYISRLGGDEFVICFYLEKDQSYVDACEAIMDGFDEKISTQGVHVKLGCCIGVTIHPDHGSNEPRTILNYADNALCKAKLVGKNTFFCFDESTRKEQELENKIKSKLHGAIENKVFHVHYQPLINIQTNKVVGFEALIRWHDEEIGWVRPDIFIAIAEKIGVVFDIDRWVFETAIKQVEEWRSDFKIPFILSINFSPSNFYHNDFSTWLLTNNFLYEKNLNWIELEVTERLILNDDYIVLEGINKLRERGIDFSIDDFGMGYSSLGYIKKFSHMLSKIKIDRMFINEILETDFDIAFVKSIMMLSDSLKLTVLAEGVEEKGQVDLLRKIGCEYVQGYYFSRPLAVSDMQGFLDGWEARVASEIGVLIDQKNNGSLTKDNNEVC
ncbi:MAG: diguanylate cyclase (GGDEF)-like protein [Candidatus Endobugula sp.]|jgi:diguanylate cyclase (GGDEF)-like protein